MFTAILVCVFCQVAPHQQIRATPAEIRMEAYRQRVEKERGSLLKKLALRSVGPRIMGGRVVDLVGFPDQPRTFLAAYASGGLWRTRDNGISWTPLFDNTASITIGDIEVDPQKPDTIWVGTGEENSSRSSYAGTGLYVSEDGGQSWAHRGLSDSHHISHILIHPKKSGTLLVSAMGHLYTTNPERGVFKTEDGGRNWKKVLFINENTGVIDMAVDPQNPDRIYASTWERSRKAWNFEEGGAGSGVYISEDGGDSWRPSNAGLPLGPRLGRIGLAVSASHPNILYASVDNQEPHPNPPVEHLPLTKKKLAAMEKTAFLAFTNEEIESFLRGNDYHKEITAKGVRDQLEAGELSLGELYDYLYDGNAALFDRPVKGVEIYRSENYGVSWRKTHDRVIEEFAWSYGYYFGVIKIDPKDPNTLYILGVPFLKSRDGGKSWKNKMQDNVHVDHQALWINPADPQHLVLGNDGGINVSGDGGSHWREMSNEAVGQLYTVAYDMAEPYRIYGGFQDNGVWYGPNKKQSRYDPPWREIQSGDGAFVQVDFRDNHTVYSGYQFGHYTREDLLSGEKLTIFPRHRLKEAPLRYNWMAPIVLSRHHQDILYMGANKVLRSLDKGENWEPISPDLTTNPPQEGDVPYGTITALRESPHEFGTLYAGTDDGRLWITRSNGNQWREISGSITRGLWVSSIEVSPHHKGTLFTTLTSYRNDDFKTYVFKSDDFGSNWQNLRGDLPEEPCNVIRQDPKNDRLLFLGTDLGLFLSFDRGEHWLPHQAGLPNVPVYAMEIHPREHDLIVATHGRSIYVLNLDILSQIEMDSFNQDLLAFAAKTAKYDKDWGGKGWKWDYHPEEEPKTEFFFFSKTPGEAQLAVSRDNELLYTAKGPAEAGVNALSWDYRITSEPKSEKKKNSATEAEKGFHLGANGKRYAKPGGYDISIEVGGRKKSFSFAIEE